MNKHCIGDKEGATPFAPGYGYMALEDGGYLCYVQMVRFSIPALPETAEAEPCEEMCEEVCGKVQQLFDVGATSVDFGYIDLCVFDWITAACSSDDAVARRIGCHIGCHAVSRFSAKSGGRVV